MNHREMNHTTQGVIVYDPVRCADKKGQRLIHKNRVVIQLRGFGLIDYYAYQFYKKFGIRLIRPSWEPHITVFADHKYSKNKNQQWGYRNGETDVIQYGHNMFWNNEHVWLPAECSAVYEIRNHYQNCPPDLGHITIGKFHPSDVGRIPQFITDKDVGLWDNLAINPF